MTRMRFKLWAVVVALLSCCEPGEPGKDRCAVDADCPAGTVCDREACLPAFQPVAGSAGLDDDPLASNGSPTGDDVPTGDDAPVIVNEPRAGDDPPTGSVDDRSSDATAVTIAADGPADAGSAPDLSQGSTDAATPPPFQNPPGQSRCQVAETTASCTYNDNRLNNRLVRWQVPLGTPPVGGWPAVVVYQGTGFGPEVTWQGDIAMPFGGFYQVLLQARLLDSGFAVIAPAAEGVAWQTNFLPPLFYPPYEEKPDYYFVLDLLEAIEAGSYGPIDPDRLYATGVSSGGYMTSRMAVSHPGRFAALAIQSASYATCSSAMCSVQTNRPPNQDDRFPPFWVIPPTLPADHPPTLFLHGAVDPMVPPASMQVYDDLLTAQGFETRVVIDPLAGHGWLPVAPDEITAWFLAH